MSIELFRGVGKWVNTNYLLIDPPEMVKSEWYQLEHWMEGNDVNQFYNRVPVRKMRLKNILEAYIKTNKSSDEMIELAKKCYFDDWYKLRAVSTDVLIRQQDNNREYVEQALKDKTSAVREIALNFIRYQPNNLDREFLIRLLNHGNRQVRAAVLQAIDINCSSVLTTVIDLALWDRATAVRLTALGKLDEREVLSLFPTLIKDSNGAVRMELIDILIRQMGNDVVPLFLDSLNNVNSPNEELAILWGLVKVCDERAASYFIARADSKDIRIQNAAINGLVCLGTESCLRKLSEIARNIEHESDIFLKHYVEAIRVEFGIDLSEIDYGLFRRIGFEDQRKIQGYVWMGLTVKEIAEIYPSYTELELANYIVVSNMFTNQDSLVFSSE